MISTFAPLLGFLLVVLTLLAFLFAFSYLVWTDRAKSPEAIAAELSLFAERTTNSVLIFGVGIATCAVIFAVARLFN
jgi:hypothetical protein